MKIKACLAVIAGILLSTGVLFGQFYSTGEAPASVHWHQLKTKHFHLVFPEGLYSDACHIARTLEYYLPLMGDSLNKPFRKYPLLVHTSSALSNGYVTLAPRRMEWVVTAPQDAYAQDWITQLALHEMRHAVQLNRLSQGFTGMFQWITGEIAPGVVSSQMPSWFYEGDAVFAETRLSSAGRGRLPGFEMPLRALVMENPKPYSYDKAVFGSYRNYVPDHYRLGYQITGYARSRYGDHIWSKAMDYTARHPYLIWPLALHLKKEYGIYKSGLYKQTMDSLKALYNNSIQYSTYSKYQSLNHRTKNVYTSYLLPKDLGNGNRLALRSGLSDPGTFVVVDSAGRVKTLFRAVGFMRLKTDLHNNLLIWDEVIRDPRWTRRDYSIIRLADLGSGKRKILTRRSRYFSPSFSPDGKQIAVAETDEQNRHFLTILNAGNGKQIMQLATPGNQALQFPEWTGQQTVCVITVSGAGKQIQEVDLVRGCWSILVPNTSYDISELLNYKKYIMFRSSFNGIENVYAVEKTDSRNLYQVTFSRYGAYHPALSRDSLNLLFSDYGVNGFDMVATPIDTLRWTPIPWPGPALPKWTDKESVLNIPPGGIKQDTTENRVYTAKPYRKMAYLFHVHSWLPFYADVDNLREEPLQTTLYPGLIVYSQNLLSTFISSLGYSYSGGYSRINPVLSWRGWYPVVELSGQIGGPSSSLPLPEGVRLPENPGTYFESALKTYVPLVFNRTGSVVIVQPSAEWQYTNTYYFNEGEGLQTGIHFVHWRLYTSHYQQLSMRDIYPRWGQSVSASFTQSPLAEGQFGNLFSVQTNLFFPGLFPHHHLYTRAGYQQQNPEKYLLPINRIDFPRGYNAAVSASFSSVQMNYAFPVVYPDMAVGPLIYLKRLRANVFSDWSYGEGIRTFQDAEAISYTGSYHSFGAELMADLHLARFIFPLSLGLRLGYIPAEEKFFNGFMVSMQTGIF